MTMMINAIVDGTERTFVLIISCAPIIRTQKNRQKMLCHGRSGVCFTCYSAGPAVFTRATRLLVIYARKRISDYSRSYVATRQTPTNTD